MSRRPLLLLLGGLLVAAGFSWFLPRTPEPGRSFPADPDRTTRAERPARPVRVVPANAGTADLILQLLPLERVAALPEVAFTHSFLAGAAAGGSQALAAQPTDGRSTNVRSWADLPRFRGYEAETFLDLEADLVVSHAWQNAETTALLERHGIPVLELELPESWEDVLAALLVCGRALGVEDRARERVLSLRTRASLLEGASPELAGLRALSYSNLGSGGWVAGSRTTADILFSLVGVRNAAAEDGIEGHASIDVERFLGLDPDVIVVGTLADGDGQSPTAAYLHGESSLAGLRALRENKIVVLPPRLFTSSSTELLAAAELLRERLVALGGAR